MTLEQLQQFHPSATLDTWHQCPKGGGWIQNTARVSGDAQVSGNAQVYGDARVSGNAWVYGNARVSGNAWVYGDARVSGNAWVYGNAWVQSPLYIQGTKHSLTHCKKGHIQIGCHCHPIAYWLEHYKAIGKMEGYSLKQLEEYKAYLELFAAIDAALFLEESTK